MYKPPFYLTILTVLIGSTGVIANGFVLFVLHKFGKLIYTANTILMIHQTFTDIVCSFFLLLVVAMKVVMDGDLEGSWGDVLCKVVISEAVFKTSVVASSLSLVCITIERYFMVVHPIFHRNHFTRRVVAVFIVAIWTVAVLLGLPLAIWNSEED